tara:strand:+ start:138 stop:449 length:312 start_codon:yes stop_codon:yes gene_type:complete
MFFFNKIKNEKFNFFYFSIPLIISGLLIVNASRNNGGIPVLNILNNDIKEAKSELKKLDRDISILQNKVNLIKGPDVDPDILEELAYQYLGFAYQQDLFIAIK